MVAAAQFKRGRLLIGYRDSNWKGVWFSPIEDARSETGISIGLFESPEGAEIEKLRFGEVHWLPHFDPTTFGAKATKKDREGLHQEFLNGAWGWFSAKNPNTYTNYLDEAGGERWESWKRLARASPRYKRKFPKNPRPRAPGFNKRPRDDDSSSSVDSGFGDGPGPPDPRPSNPGPSNARPAFLTPKSNRKNPTKKTPPYRVSTVPPREGSDESLGSSAISRPNSDLQMSGGLASRADSQDLFGDDGLGNKSLFNDMPPPPRRRSDLNNNNGSRRGTPIGPVRKASSVTAEDSDDDGLEEKYGPGHKVGRSSSAQSGFFGNEAIGKEVAEEDISAEERALRTEEEQLQEALRRSVDPTHDVRPEAENGAAE